MHDLCDSLIRCEGTGYGAVYFAQEMLALQDNFLAGRHTISGSGNVGQFTNKKWRHPGAMPLNLSDSDGPVYSPKAVTLEQNRIRQIFPTGLVKVATALHGILLRDVSLATHFLVEHDLFDRASFPERKATSQAAPKIQPSRRAWAASSSVKVG